MLPIEVAIDAAYAAGEILRQHFGKSLNHYKKGDGANDFFTEADLQSENLIISNIRKYFSNDSILAEESQPFTSGATQSIWVIDPLDGTYNFVHGMNHCGVMIARVTQGLVELAVLYNPFKKTMVTAKRGQGVYVNDKLKKFIQTGDVRLTIVADDRGFAPILVRHGLETTCLWSSVDNALLLLSGQKNAYFNKTAKVWDLTPLSLCFEEYGLQISDQDQVSFKWSREANGLIALPQSKLEEAKEYLEIR